MAEALYDVIVAGVPHCILEASDIDIADVTLDWGQTGKLACATANALREQYDFVARAEPGPVARLAVALSFRGLRVGVIDLGSSPFVLQIPEDAGVLSFPQFSENQKTGSMANACRLEFKSSHNQTATAFHYGAVDTSAIKQSTLLVRASKFLVLEDRLWDVDGGAEFAGAAIDVARSAGRRVVLVCKDADCILRSSASIRKWTDKRIDYVIGEATSLQRLYNLERPDCLVQKLRSLSMGAIVWRNHLAPLILEGNVIGPNAVDEMVDGITFWNTFLPDRLSMLFKTGTVLKSMEQLWLRSPRVHDRSI